MLEINFKRNDGVAAFGCRCSEARFKQLWSYFKSRWTFCRIKRFDGEQLTEIWVWSAANGWHKV